MFVIILILKTPLWPHLIGSSPATAEWINASSHPCRWNQWVMTWSSSTDFSTWWKASSGILTCTWAPTYAASCPVSCTASWSRWLPPSTRSMTTGHSGITLPCCSVTYSGEEFSNARSVATLALTHYNILSLCSLCQFDIFLIRWP